MFNADCRGGIHWRREEVKEREYLVIFSVVVGLVLEPTEKRIFFLIIFNPKLKEIIKRKKIEE